MKTKLLLSVLLSFVFCLLSSQVPQGFNYQAIARDTTGKPIINTLLPVMITIQSDSLGGTRFWIEEHNSVTTNSYGLFNIILGKGVKQLGSTVNTFYDIDWSATPKFIKTEIFKDGWQNMGSSRLWAVPYSMVAGDLNDTLKKLIVKGQTDIMDEALFEVKNKTGQTVFAVYNEGVRVYVDDGSKGKKAGFAIGGFNKVKDGINQDYFIVNRDSVRVYLDTLSAKTRKGGFAIGGFNRTKGVGDEEYLRVTRDSTRIYINDAPAKGIKGGFAIGGFGNNKGTITPFTSLTPSNYFIGHNSGIKNTTGKHNSVIGFESAYNNTEGSDNVFLGYQSGYSNKLGLNNIFIGSSAGYSNIGEIQTIPYITEYGSYNIFIGNSAGYSNVSGFVNVFLGNLAGYSNISGISNTFVGNFSGENNSDGWGNANVGAYSGRSNISGVRNVNLGYYSGNKNISSYNTFLGANSGENNISGINNTMVGWGAGGNSTGSNNVFIGSGAGFDESGNYKLYIAQGTTVPLIGGDFIGNRVGINRMPTTYTLEVGGSIWANGTTIVAGSTTWSDARYKTNITPITSALAYILKMQGVWYNWRQSEFPELNFPKGEQIGVIAQDLEKILPELVFTGPDGYMSVSYEKLTPVLIEAIKEQQNRIESQQKELDELKSLVKSLITNQTAQVNN